MTAKQEIWAPKAKRPVPTNIAAFFESNGLMPSKEEIKEKEMFLSNRALWCNWVNEFLLSIGETPDAFDRDPAIVFWIRIGRVLTWITVNTDITFAISINGKDGLHGFKRVPLWNMPLGEINNPDTNPCAVMDRIKDWIDYIKKEAATL